MDAKWCFDGRICATNPEFVGPDRPYSGRCVSERYCLESRGAGLPTVCRYSDGTPYMDGPPEESSCPTGTDPRSPFCGGPCDPDGCPFFDDPFHLGRWQISCVGLSETRGLGLCTFGQIPCTRERWFASVADDCTLLTGTPCACLVLRGEDGELQSFGWPTFEQSCRAYRSQYPGEVECMDPTTFTPLN